MRALRAGVLGAARLKKENEMEGGHSPLEATLSHSLPQSPALAHHPALVRASHSATSGCIPISCPIAAGRRCVTGGGAPRCGRKREAVFPLTGKPTAHSASPWLAPRPSRLPRFSALPCHAIARPCHADMDAGQDGALRAVQPALAARIKKKAAPTRAGGMLCFEGRLAARVWAIGSFRASSPPPPTPVRPPALLLVRPPPLDG